MATTPAQLTSQFVTFKGIHWEFGYIGQLIIIPHSLISNGTEEGWQTWYAIQCTMYYLSPFSPLLAFALCSFLIPLPKMFSGFYIQVYTIVFWLPEELQPERLLKNHCIFSFTSLLITNIVSAWESRAMWVPTAGLLKISLISNKDPVPWLMHGHSGQTRC